MFQSPFDLAALAMYEAIDPVVLGLEGAKEGVTESPLGGGALPGDRRSFAGARGRLVLYEIFEKIVIDVDCDAI